MFLRKRTKGSGTRGERGQSLVEFALIAPLFLVLVFAIVDFGMGFHAWITVTNSAREGARYAAVGAPKSGATSCSPLPAAGTIERRVCDTAAGLTATKMTLSVTNAQGQPGGSVVVRVDYRYDLITPLAGLVQFISGDVLGSTINFSSSADMRLE
ncbi:MAG TPA: TadE family protein [Dehalococcoidia bacterium]|nr:TadE family protein [Dehalococcoidia bacterium]